jgi:16S rRNA pseudouridine516 synthase
VKLLKYIANLGYGSRREVQAMLDAGRIRGAQGQMLSAKDQPAHAEIFIDGAPMDPPPGTVLMLHKPCGYTCSTRDPNHVVYDLLPPRFALRSPIIAPIGRLDRQTSGLLLLSDDGDLQHRITSPRSQLPKKYLAQLDSPPALDTAEIFASGTLMLDGESTPLQPAKLRMLGALSAEIIITEGRYHQVRRMFAALGCHVLSLHRSAIGTLELGDLAEGAWRVLDLDYAALAVSMPVNSSA